MVAAHHPPKQFFRPRFAAGTFAATIWGREVYLDVLEVALAVGLKKPKCILARVPEHARKLWVTPWSEGVPRVFSCPWGVARIFDRTRSPHRAKFFSWLTNAESLLIAAAPAIVADTCEAIVNRKDESIGALEEAAEIIGGLSRQHSTLQAAIRQSEPCHSN